MSWYKDNFEDYQLIFDPSEDSEVYCTSCGEGCFYRLGDWCICNECGRRIHIDDIERYIRHEFF